MFLVTIHPHTPAASRVAAARHLLTTLGWHASCAAVNPLPLTNEGV
jgi:hypothetical protein